jgi:hypothetical protein
MITAPYTMTDRPARTDDHLDRLTEGPDANLLGTADAWEGSLNSVSYYCVRHNGRHLVYRRISYSQEEWTGLTLDEFDPSKLPNWEPAP